MTELEEVKAALADINKTLDKIILQNKNVKSIKHRSNNIHVLLYTDMEVILPEERYIVREVKDENNTKSSNH